MSFGENIASNARYIRTKAKDSEAARNRFRIAKVLGYPYADEEIALCYEDEGRWEKAFKAHQKAAEKGDRNALVSLAHCYLEGNGTRKSLPDYIQCLKDAAEAGSFNAMIELGDCYRDGVGVRTNEAKAREIYEQAAAKGSKKAQERIEELDEVKEEAIDPTKEPEVPAKTAPDESALRWYKKAVLDENPDAEAKLGIWTLLGLGVPQNIPMAKQLLADAAEGGNKEAKALVRDMSSDTAQGMEAATQYTLGQLFSNDKYIEPDDAKAFAAYKSAAKAGHIKAMYELGQCYEEGRGVKADIAQAKNWNDKAYATGLKDAEKAKDRIDAAAEEAEAEAKAKAKAKAQETKAKVKAEAEKVAEATKTTAKKAAEATKTTAKKAAEATKTTAKKAAEATKETAKKAAEATKKTAAKAAEATKTTAKKAAETTKKAAETVKKAAESKKKK